MTNMMVEAKETATALVEEIGGAYEIAMEISYKEITTKEYVDELIGPDEDDREDYEEYLNAVAAYVEEMIKGMM